VAEPNINARKAGALRALLASRSVEEAAQKAGVSKVTIFRWLRKDREFLEEYESACSQLVDEALMQLRQICRTAVDTLAEVMADGEATAAGRVTAARAALELTLKIEEHRTLLRRIERLETRMKDRRNDALN
jgi:transposase